MKIKLCGMRRPEDIGYVNEFCPDYAGFILSPGFKRSITADTFDILDSMLDRSINRVGVFVNEPVENIIRLSNKLDAVQLHGDESAEYLQGLKDSIKCQVWKAVRVRTTEEIEQADSSGADMLLLDSFVPGSPGGTGKTADYDIIKKAVFYTPFFVAGGLDCNNVTTAINEVSPDGVDISGGIETNGFKDRDKIKKFMETVRSVYK